MIIFSAQILAAAGFIISLYFTLVYHRLLSPNAKWIPSVCRMEEGICDEIIHTPDARLLKIPNFYLGGIFYLLFILALLFIKPFTVVADGFMIALGFAIGMGIYLTYSLLFVLKKTCVLCLGTHVINLVLFLLLVIYQ
jgi:uncharacterized membrane protein